MDKKVHNDAQVSMIFEGGFFLVGSKACKPLTSTKPSLRARNSARGPWRPRPPGRAIVIPQA